jgi:hypothetical protein
MPADETPESLSGFEERLRHLESELSAEQERSRLLENRVRQMEQILEVYGLTLPIDDNPLPKEWLLNNARSKKLSRLLELLTLIEQYWNGCQYEFRVRGHKRVTLFQILGEISLCLDVPQTSFIEFIIKYTDLGTNPNTIKSNLRYAAKWWKD